MYTWYLVEGVNPEPWTAPEGTVGRKGGKSFVQFHKPQQARQYQESLKSEFQIQNPQAVKVAGDIEIVFYFWRQLPTFEIHEGKKTRQSAYADATNLQKSTEDALQGILYNNDRDIISVRSVIVEQEKETEAAILIAITTTDTDKASSEEHASIQHIRRVLSQPRVVSESNLRSINVEDVF